MEKHATTNIRKIAIYCKAFLSRIISGTPLTLDMLLDVMNPPIYPVEAVDQTQWDIFELITGITLPNDYKNYLGVFGTGIIGGVILPYNPFCIRPLLQIHYTGRIWMQEALAIQALKWQFGPHVFPYPVYPEPDGLLPWGQTENGDRLFWRTHGSPNNWHIVINEVRSSIFEAFDGSMTKWIHGLITGAIESTIIPYDALDQTNLFEAR
jgi:hypothetical protein